VNDKARGNGLFDPIGNVVESLRLEYVTLTDEVSQLDDKRDRLARLSVLFDLIGEETGEHVDPEVDADIERRLDEFSL
jgi:hypothetical protein